MKREGKADMADVPEDSLPSAKAESSCRSQREASISRISTIDYTFGSHAEQSRTPSFLSRLLTDRLFFNG